MNIDLVYLSDNTYGGWVTFTRHLHDALHNAGVNVRIVKVRNSCYDGRDFGYGLQYSARTLTALQLESSVKLIVAMHKNYSNAAQALLQNNHNAVVVHDHNELKHVPQLPGDRCIVIRKVNTRLVPGATFIPHPYVPCETPWIRKNIWARSVCRIDHDKNTHLLLLANRLLPENRKIDIRGFDNRIYTRFSIMPKFPEYVQSKAHFPREKDAAFKLLQPVRYMVDMSTIKGDGGGSQYTFLEAANAGACCVLNTQWCSVKGEMQPGKNCLVAADEHELKKVLTRTPETTRYGIVENALALLDAHNPKKIAGQYIKFMESL